MNRLTTGTGRVLRPLARRAAGRLHHRRAPTTSGGVPIDTSRSARGQDSRVLFLILHYTVADLPISLKVLTEHEVSAHYLVSDETPPRIFRLVDESRRAWHSGASAWKGHRMLNASSIGIEIVHPGFKPGPDGERIYQPFPEAQMEALIPLLQDIVQRHGIRPDRILGHGEVSPAVQGRPGADLPVAAAGRTGHHAALARRQRAWPRSASASRRCCPTSPGSSARWRSTATRWSPPAQMDEQTQRVLMNFQMRYRPERHDGAPDAETAALLHVLTNPVKLP